MYYLLEKQTAVQSAAIPTVVPNQFEHENRSVEQKSRDKKGSRVKNLAVKKLQ